MKAERLRLARISTDLPFETRHAVTRSAPHDAEADDPFNLASMIRNVTRAYDSRTRPTAQDIFEPRGTPAIQLSPSPELEPLPILDNVLPMNNSRDPDSMDWEPTDPVTVTTPLRVDAQTVQHCATSVWDRFATTKQRIFARERLTGLERAFESWKGLGSSAVAEPEPKRQGMPSAVSAPCGRGLVPATLTLASVLRVLSVAVNKPRTATSRDAAINDIACFRIMASSMEIFCTIPRVIHVRRWRIQVSSISLTANRCQGKGLTLVSVFPTSVAGISSFRLHYCGTSADSNSTSGSRALNSSDLYSRCTHGSHESGGGLYFVARPYVRITSAPYSSKTSPL